MAYGLSVFSEICLEGKGNDWLQDRLIVLPDCVQVTVGGQQHPPLRLPACPKLIWNSVLPPCALKPAAYQLNKRNDRQTQLRSFNICCGFSAFCYMLRSLKPSSSGCDFYKDMNITVVCVHVRFGFSICTRTYLNVI